MKFVTVALGLSVWSVMSVAQVGEKDVQKRLCMLEKMRPENASMTVGEIIKACEERPAQPDSLIVERAKLENASFENPYSITPHRPNYVLAGVLNSHTPTSPPFQVANDGQGSPDKVESEFQISLKFPFVRNIGSRDSGVHWMAAYTNRSFWQVYNGDWSRPFRETNHEPETWVQFPLQGRIPGTDMQLRAGFVGFNHQSNGQTGQWSRSWNRILGTVVADNGKFALGFKPWWRIPEDEGSDDNRDILHYMGNFELHGTYRFTPRHQLTFMLRNNLETEHNRGAYELSYGFPFPGTDDLRIYIQAFHGYGKSLIDYNLKQSSLGIGLQLVDW